MPRLKVIALEDATLTTILLADEEIEQTLYGDAGEESLRPITISEADAILQPACRGCRRGSSGDELTRHAIATLRNAGRSWAKIGQALGTSGSTAWARYGKA